MTIREAQRICNEVAVEHGWWQADRNDGEAIALMHSELSEALEELRSPEGIDWGLVAEELADTVIRIMDYCGGRGLDLEDAIAKKIEINRKRPYRHGGKRA